MMSTRRTVAAFALALPLVLAACERPTAPQARDAIEKTGTALASGDFSQLQMGMSELFWMATYYGSEGGGGKYVPSAYVPVIRNAVKAPYRATVVERMYLPPERSGGRAYSRFTLVGWSDADSIGRMKLIAMFTSDSVSTVTVPTNDAVAQGTYATARWQPGFVLAADHADRRAWYGTDGTLVIRTGPRMGDCPYASETRGFSSIAELQADSTNRLLCETRRYDASMTSFIERGDPSARGIMTRIDPPLRETLRMEETTVPGVRIVTQCAGMGPPADPPGCFNVWSFWRSDEQFAPALGIHLDSMERRRDDFMVQVIDTGSGPDFRLERGGYDVPLGYTVFATNGEVLREQARTTAQADEPIRWLAQELPQRVGAHYRIVTRPVMAGLVPMSMIVVDLRFLSFR